MKRILLVSHCVLNSYCETPPAGDYYREGLLRAVLEKHLSIVQLPCPELCFQGLFRESINPGTEKAAEYEEYCEALLEPIVENLIQYKENGIEAAGIIGIDTSPSCSVVDVDAIMMKILFKRLKAEGIDIHFKVDMPIADGNENFVEVVRQV
ncbi:MAG: hypothetical protein ACOX4R_05285 [Lentihominibacter sp.]|jgi:predicted secreted protein